MEDISYVYRSISHVMIASSVYRAALQDYRFTGGILYRSFQRGYQWSLGISGYRFGPYIGLHIYFAICIGGLAYFETRVPKAHFYLHG